MKIFGYIIILLILILGISFAILNATPVSVHYYLGIKQLPLSLVIVIAFGVGLLVSLIFMSIIVFKEKTAKRRCYKRLKVAEQEINNLRAIPIKESIELD